MKAAGLRPSRRSSDDEPNACASDGWTAARREIYTMGNEALQTAIDNRIREYNTAVEKLREIAPDDIADEAYDLTRTLREGIELVRCLRRLVDGRTPNEIHKAFGAPGDFGYEHPIGRALAGVYKTPR